MKNKYVFFCLLFMFLIQFGSAEIATLPAVRQNTCTDLIQSHPNATYMNITSIRYPDGSYDINWKPLITLNGIDYTYQFCNTSQVGEYIVQTCGDGDGVFDCPPPYNFLVTWTGLEEQQERTILFWIYSAAILLSLALIAMAWKVEMTWLGFLAGILAILPGINLMIHGFGFVETTLVRGIATVFIVFGMLTMVIFAFEYNHFFGLKGMFGDSFESNEKEKQDEYDYFQNPD